MHIADNKFLKEIKVTLNLKMGLSFLSVFAHHVVSKPLFYCNHTLTNRAWWEDTTKGIKAAVTALKQRTCVHTCKLTH